MQDTICDEVMTIEEIVQHSFRTLKPEKVYPDFGIREWRHHCVSCIYTQVRDENGEILPLAPDEKGRVTAIYGRVSLLRQRGDEKEDGYSIEDQFRFNIRAAVAKKQAFRIYNDAGCSGHWMTAEEHLIREVRETSAKLYQEVFTEAFLKDADKWNDSEQIAGMLAYMEQRCRDLKAGKHVTQFSQQQDDEPLHSLQRALHLRYKKNIHKNSYRPALHALVEDVPNTHSVFVTDHDRLSRNQVLFAVLGVLFRVAEVTVYTSAGRADWMTGNDLASQLLFVVNTQQATAHIRTTKLRSLVGYKGMLLKGRPHGDLPFWLRRTKKKEAEFVPELMPVIYRMVEFALRRGSEYMSLEKISDTLVKEGFFSPEEKRWDETMIARSLENPLLFGCAYTFGREWEIATPDPEGTRRQFPSPFITDEEYDPDTPLALLTKEKAFEMLEYRQGQKKTRRGRPPRAPFLLAKIIKCRCGYAMRYESNQDAMDRPEGGAENKRSKLMPVLTCNAKTWQKRATNIPHTNLPPREVVKFFTDLITSHADLILQKSEPVDKEVTLDEQERRVRDEFAALRKQKRQEFAALLRNTGAREDTPEFQTAIESMLAAGLRDSQQALKENLERIERMRVMQQKRQETASAAEEIKHFTDLSPERKNEIMMQFIREVRTKADENDREYMHILLQSGIELPPIWYKVTIWKDGTRVRSLPTVEEWIDAIVRGALDQ